MATALQSLPWEAFHWGESSMVLTAHTRGDISIINYVFPNVGFPQKLIFFYFNRTKQLAKNTIIISHETFRLYTIMGPSQGKSAPKDTRG